MSILKKLGLATAAAIALSAASAAEADQIITIAYQTGLSPFNRAVASGEIQKIPGWNVEFKQFNSGAEIFAALASGDVQIGDVGSSPFAAATSRGLDVKAIYITAGAGNDEALVVRKDAGIESPADLRGKRLAAAPVSTDHYMLLSTLKQEGIGPDEATVLAIPQPEIVAAWERGDIDGAFVWDPALAKLLETGKLLLTAKQAAERGAVTFGALVATGNTIESHADFLQAFVRIVDKYYRDYRSNPGNWTADSDNVQSLAKFIGATPEDVVLRVAGATYIPAIEQAGPNWLGADSGVPSVLRSTSEFLKEQQKVSSVLDSYAPFVDPRFVQAVLASN